MNTINSLKHKQKVVIQMIKISSQQDIWKNIKGYEGWYQVSNTGKIRSMDRTITYWNKKYNCFVNQKTKGKIIKPTDNGSGYLTVHLRVNKHRKMFYIHRLVAETFLINDENKKEINHKDYNKYNNNVDNLEWVTRQENVNHSVKHMKKQKNVVNPKTGLKYISVRNNKYRVRINWNDIKYDNLFTSLNEAVKARDNLLNKIA